MQWRWARAHGDIDITGEGGALATSRGSDGYGFRSAVCGEVLQAEGEAYAEFTWVSGSSIPQVGVARAGVDPSSLEDGLFRTADGWMYRCSDGTHWHNNSHSRCASGEPQGIKKGETVGLLLRRGSLAVYIQGLRVGVMCTGLSGPLVWATDLSFNYCSAWVQGSSMRIARRPPPADWD